MKDQEITKEIIGAAIKIHKKLGPGLLENVYKECLFYELKKSSLIVSKEVSLPVKYEDVFLESGYRLDLLVEQKIIIELKTVDFIHEKHIAQLLTYLKLSNNKLGLLINFNEVTLKDGLKRVVNNYLE
jgi:GxxExxY protein